jgi:hypothetical protein
VSFTHVPPPLQMLPMALFVVSVHSLAPHDRPAGAKARQPPDPLHLPSGPQGTCGSAGQLSL